MKIKSHILFVVVFTSFLTVALADREDVKFFSIGEYLTIEDCRRVSALDDLQIVQIGQPLEGAAIQKGGLAELAQAENLRYLRLSMAGLPVDELRFLRDLKHFKTLDVSGGPYLIDSEGNPQLGMIDQYEKVATSSFFEVISSLPITEFYLYLPLESIKISDLNALLSSETLISISITCKEIIQNRDFIRSKVQIRTVLIKEERKDR